MGLMSMSQQVRRVQPSTSSVSLGPVYHLAAALIAP